MNRHPSGVRRKVDPASERTPDVAHEFAAKVGDAIRRARQGRGWTQVELAEAAQLSPNYVARLERGELGPSLYVAHHLARALGTDIDSLLSPRRAVPALTRRATRA